MKLLVQRVKEAQVFVENNIISNIGKGLLVYLGISKNDYDERIDDYIINKLLKQRLFEDNDDKINLSVEDINGEILIVSNFTLYGDTKKGTRPSFSNAAKIEDARIIYNRFVEKLKLITNLNIKEGKFQAMMEVKSICEGPVNIIIEKEI